MNAQPVFFEHSEPIMLLFGKARFDDKGDMGKEGGFRVDQILDPIGIHLKGAGENLREISNIFFAGYNPQSFAGLTGLPRDRWNLGDLAVINGRIITYPVDS